MVEEKENTELELVGPKTNHDRWSTTEGEKYYQKVRDQIISAQKNRVSGSPVLLDFSKLISNPLFPNIQNRVDLAGIDLSKIEFLQCELKNCVFDDGKFEGAEFSEVLLTNVSFNTCIFRNAILANVVIQNGTTFDNSDFRDAQLSIIKGLSDQSLSIPFKYSEPHYLRILFATFSQMIRGKYYAGTHTVFNTVDTKNLTDSCNKELREYINWYQHLMNQLNRFHERSHLNKFSLFLGILLTKYWNSFWVLTFWAFVGNALVATLINSFPVFFEFQHTNLDSWNWFDAFYYCVVTFTTLGYGDVTPCNFPAQFAAGFVAVSGYFTLGILVYLIARKVDRKF